MAAKRKSFDTLVIGGGPAGSTAARLLSLWGHSVRLLTKPPTKQTPLAESLPPSCRKIFARAGVLEAIDAAGFYRTTGNTVWWGDPNGRMECFADGGTGLQVVRAEFDRLLLDLAEQAGVEVHRDATVRRIRTGEPPPPEGAPSADAEDYGWVEYETAAARTSTGANWVLDCTGRAGVISRLRLRRHEKRRTTLGLVGVWRRSGGWEVPDETHTLVESYRDGWAWSVPVSATVRYFTVMVDPQVTALLRGGALNAMYRAELAKTEEFRRMLADATPQCAPWGCGASQYSAADFSGPGFLLVGDAASFIDPLASFGVKKAMASAWLAAVVVHTCLTNPAMRGAALELFGSREREMYTSYRELSARYFGAAARQHRHPFWADRSEATMEPLWGGAGASAHLEPDIERLRRDPEVQAAFEALRESPSIRLERTDRVRVVRKPTVRGHEVVFEDRLVTSSMPSGIRFLRGIDLPRLVEMANRQEQVPDLYEAYNRVCPPVILPDFVGALSVLLAMGMLDNRAVNA